MPQVSRAVRWLLASRGGLALIAFAFLVAQLYAVASDHFLHDEGVLTYLGPRYLPLDPPSLLFFAKLRPTVSIVYALPALFGYDAFLVAHVLLATAALALFASVSRALGHDLPNLAALLVGTSPVYLAAGAGGLSNGDGAVMTAVALYLLVVRRAPIATGVALSAACFVRYELAVFATVFGVLGLLTFGGRQRARFVAAAVALPLVYVAAGALYHDDLLWLARLPPSGEAIAGHPLSEAGSSGHLTADAVGLLLSVSPLFGFALLALPGGLNRVERALAVFVVVYHTIMFAFPVFDIMGVGLVGGLDRLPRYSMLSVGCVALLATRTVSRLSLPSSAPEERPGATTALLALFVVFAIVADVEVGLRLAPLMVAGYCAVVVAARAGAKPLAAVVVIALAVASPVLPTMQRERDLEVLAGYRPMARWVGAHLSELEGVPVLTNSHLIRFALRHDPEAEELDLRFMIQAQMASELLTMTNPDNDQQAAVRRMLDYDFYAPPIWPEDLTPERVPEGAYVVARRDRRLELVMPAARWAGRLEEIDGEDTFVVWRVVAPDRAEAR